MFPFKLFKSLLHKNKKSGKRSENIMEKKGEKKMLPTRLDPGTPA